MLLILLHNVEEFDIFQEGINAIVKMHIYVTEEDSQAKDHF
jgi:hypothetical protein